MSTKKPYHMEIKRNAANQIHCDDGPAMIDGDHQRWFKNGVLHREDGPAVEYFRSPEDNLYLIDGVALCGTGDFDLARRIVMDPSSLTFEEIINISNEEIKRVAIDRKGTENFLTEGKAVVIDKAINDVEGTTECIFKCDKLQFFCGVCVSTGRVYYIEIDPKVKRCQEAREFLSSGKNLNMCIGAS